MPSSCWRCRRGAVLARNAFEGVEAFPAETRRRRTTPPRTRRLRVGDAPRRVGASSPTRSRSPRLDVLDGRPTRCARFGARARGGLDRAFAREQRHGGPIPPWLGERDTLVHVRLDGNALEGSLESWLGTNRLLDLQSLRVDGNPGISGPLSPNAIRRMTRLKRLNVSGVTSFGAFPHGLGVAGASLDALTHLHARGSGLNGTLPATLFAALPNLRTLDLRDNALSGFVPGDHLRTHASRDAAPLRQHVQWGFPGLSDALETRRRRRHVRADRARAKVVDLRGAGDEAAEASSAPHETPLRAQAWSARARRAGADAGGFTCAPCAPARSRRTPAPRVPPLPRGSVRGNDGRRRVRAVRAGAASGTAGSARCEPCGLGFFAALEVRDVRRVTGTFAGGA